VQTADLVSTLNNTGPFTVFAPTDAAFAVIPTWVLNDLLANKTTLTSVLTYHVVSGKLMAADVVTYSALSTVQGEDVKITATPSGVWVNEAKVIQTDIECSNGVIHVIDALLVPP